MYFDFQQFLSLLHGYSDIDNYLIANSVEILERCEIRGFVIISSDKDYLPVLRIAIHKKVKTRIIGIISNNKIPRVASIISEIKTWTNINQTGSPKAKFRTTAT